MDLKNFVLFKQGAEAKIYKGIYLGKPTLAKERFSKNYRHPDLDHFISTERIRAESRAIVRCKAAGIRTPMLYLVDFNRRIIFLEYFENHITVKDFIEKCSCEESLKKLSMRIGHLIARMHSNNIIHGDLTTSNILMINNGDQKLTMENMDLVLIDFGLAHLESSAEDKGVDLYVLERALISTHSAATEMFVDILNGYKEENTKNFKEIFSKYEEVRARGRKRTMVG